MMPSVDKSLAKVQAFVICTNEQAITLATFVREQWSGNHQMASLLSSHFLDIAMPGPIWCICE